MYLLQEWDQEKNAPLTPDSVHKGSHQKVWWHCENGHTWRSEIRVRANGALCPYCTRRMLWVESNDLLTLNPALEGEISRESFAAQKKALTAQAEEISHTVLELERKISDSDDGGNAVIEQFKSYAGITALTREISADLLQSVTIYPDGRMDIRLNLADEIESLLETLRRESCTA